MPISNINTALLNKIAAAGSSGNDLVSLKAKLNTLMKAVKELANDSSMSADAKKRIQKLLQMQIQQVMQQIAELQSKGGKGEAIQEAPSKQTLLQLLQSHVVGKSKSKIATSAEAAASASGPTTASSTSGNAIDTFA